MAVYIVLVEKFYICQNGAGFVIIDLIKPYIYIESKLR